MSLSSLIWSVAELLRGNYKPFYYDKIILPSPSYVASTASLGQPKGRF